MRFKSKGRNLKGRSESASVMVEFAVSIFAFALLIFGSSQFAIVGYRAVALNYVAASTMRWAILGKTIGNLSRVRSIEKTARDHALVYGIRLTNREIHICEAADPDCSNDSDSATQPNTPMVITLNAPTHLIFDSFILTPSARVVGTNEP